jgi:hypothetical protein
MSKQTQKIIQTKSPSQNYLDPFGFDKIRPAVFTASVLGVFLVGGFVTWAISGQFNQKKVTQQVAAVREKADGSIVLDRYNTEAQQIDDAKNKSEADIQNEEVKAVSNMQIAPLSNNSSHTLKIPELDCVFTYSTEKPDSSSVFVENQSGFWLPSTDCKNKSIIALQITETSDTSKLFKAESHRLNFEDKFVIVYWTTDEKPAQVDYSKYAKELVSPIKTTINN